MSRLEHRPWVPDASAQLIRRVAAATAGAGSEELDDRLHRLVDDNRRIHERECVNLNPAANVMNPRAEALLSAGLGSRPSLGHPGDKYETGLEAVEEIEVIASELAAEVFDAAFAEIRVPSGAMANLFAFMACSRPGDAIIVPPASIGGHVTHHSPGAAGLYGLTIHEAPVDPERYTIDPVALAELAERVQPAMITIGGSLNLHHHPVAEIRSIADSVGATVLFDAAHLSGLIAGGAWPDPLAAGAQIMTMSTYKSLAGPPAGLVLTTDPTIAERVDSIAFPGMTANFDVAKSAALALTLLDWQARGRAYATTMRTAADTLAASLTSVGVPVWQAGGSAGSSHAVALDARELGGGHTLARRLRRANLLASAIGLPVGHVEGDPAPGLRIGTNEIVRWGMTASHMPELAALIACAIADPAGTAPAVTEFRSAFTDIHFVRP